jgi:hypothetical protein
MFRSQQPKQNSAKFTNPTTAQSAVLLPTALKALLMQQQPAHAAAGLSEHPQVLSQLTDKEHC